MPEPFMWRDAHSGLWMSTGWKDKRGKLILDRIGEATRLPIDQVEKEFGPLTPVGSPE